MTRTPAQNQFPAQRRGFFGLPCLLGLVLAGLSSQTAQGAPVIIAPQPISDAERAAVELALAYVDGGAGAWWPRLAKDAPLRALGEAAARQELESRLGRAGEASWELETLLADPPPGLAAFRLERQGGVDDLVYLDLVQEAGVSAHGGWVLSRLRSWGDVMPRPNADSAAKTPASAAAPPLSSGRRLAALMGVLLAVVLALAALLFSRFKPRLAVASLAAALLSAGGGVLLLSFNPGAGSRQEPEAATPRPTDPATLKKAQHELHIGNTAEATRLLAALPNPSLVPMTEVLRARLALLAGNEVDTVLYYQRAIDTLPVTDSLLIEKFDALALGGFEERARDSLLKLASGGSRHAGANYMLAREALGAGDQARAKSRLRQAWDLSPLERGQLLADPFFAYLVVSGDLFQRLRLNRPQEPTVGAHDLGKRAVTLPPGFAASVSGRELRLARGSVVVTVPGGSALAPSGTVVEDALTRRQREEAEALAGLGALKIAARSPSAMAQPSLREKLEATGFALYRKQRWLDLVELTQTVAANPERLPTNVMHMRAEALAKTYGPEQATRFMLLVASSQAVERRRDPYALLRLARYLKDAEQFDLAAQVASRAEALLPEPPASSMVPLIHMERQLATAYQVHETKHFRLRYPSREGVLVAASFGRLLERELVRLQRWIPFRPAQKIGIDLFPYQDFRTHYSMGGHAIGLFDGKVRVPFANVRYFNRFVVEVLSHELAHALIAGATEDRAPHWFHEGLAQHIEMKNNEVNPIGDLRRAGKLLAFPLLEPVFTSRVNSDLVSLAYSEAAWAIHAIEAQHGVGGIHRLLRAFGRGLDTDEAVREALGLSVAELDQRIWDWCEHKGPTVWSRPVTEYRLQE